MKDREVSPIATVSIRLAVRNECYEAFICVCKELARKTVSLTFVYFAPATLCSVTLEKTSCTSLVAFCTPHLSGEMQSFDSYRTEF